MAVDTQEKRMSVVGAGRPWLRSRLPGTIDAQARAGIGLSYNGITFSSVTIITGFACWAQGEVYNLGYQQGEEYTLGFQKGQEYNPGFQKGQEAC